MIHNGCTDRKGMGGKSRKRRRIRQKGENGASGVSEPFLKLTKGQRAGRWVYSWCCNASLVDGSGLGEVRANQGLPLM